ncbi:MAG TPA: hypothetical protein PLF32_01355 [Bacteroidales bacterium]|nr:hypothetical protein [Bacteroidales bacterium]HOR81287.1 hypothetical protein [Bacteroidales bacterium]HPJ90554.1 hypothetical protein [Bacteroidales bacterium]
MKYIKLLTSNKLKIIIYLLLILSCFGCDLFAWDRTDMIYYVTIKNDTQDTINIEIGDGGMYTYYATFMPDSSEVFNSKEIRYDKEKKIDIKKVFADADRQWLSGFKVYRHDSLLVNWEGPPREMGTEIHHFYNYSSWKCYETSKWEGVVLFTIKDSDLK